MQPLHPLLISNRLKEYFDHLPLNFLCSFLSNFISDVNLPLLNLLLSVDELYFKVLIENSKILLGFFIVDA